MKLTKSQLKRILREEISNFLKEGEASEELGGFFTQPSGTGPQAATQAAEDQEEVTIAESGFIKMNAIVYHPEYGRGVVAHPGSKSTDGVALVEFDKDKKEKNNFKTGRRVLRKSLRPQPRR